MGAAALAHAQPYKDRQTAIAASVLPPGLRDVGLDQKLNAQVPLDLQFRDDTGREVPLSSYFGTRPVILALVYYQCPMLCTQILNGLVISLRGMSLESGRDFDVVSVSIDPTETPELAARKKAEYCAALRQEPARLALSHRRRAADQGTGARGRISLRLRSKDQTIRPRERHHGAHSHR